MTMSLFKKSDIAPAQLAKLKWFLVNAPSAILAFFEFIGKQSDKLTIQQMRLFLATKGIKAFHPEEVQKAFKKLNQKLENESRVKIFDDKTTFSHEWGKYLFYRRSLKIGVVLEEISTKKIGLITRIKQDGVYTKVFIDFTDDTHGEILLFELIKHIENKQIQFYKI